MVGGVSGWGAEPAFGPYVRRKVEQHPLPANPPAPPPLAGRDVTRAARAGVPLAGSQRPRQSTRVSSDRVSPRMVFSQGHFATAMWARPQFSGHLNGWP